MNTHLLPYLVPLLLCCSCAEEQKATGWTKPALEGQWTFVSAEKVEDSPFLSHYPNPHTPAREVGPAEPPYIGPDLIFEKDTVYEVYGQMEFMYGSHFSIDSGYLHFGREWLGNTHPVEFKNDTLFIYKPYYDKIYVKEGYLKTTRNDSVINEIRKHGANYPAMAGTWYLVREFSSEDGSEGYTLDFPHIIPDTIEISRAEFIGGLEQNKRYMLSTDGDKQEYFFSYSWGDLLLTPGDWYQGEDTRLIYTRN